MRSPNGIRPRPMRARRIPNRWPPASVLTQSPDLLKILESLQVVFLFESAFDSELRQDSHHLSDRYARQFRCPAERDLSLLVSLDPARDSPARAILWNAFNSSPPCPF